MDKSTFAQLLTEIIKKISVGTGKKMSLIQDDLGYACGKKGGSYIEYLRKGNVPKSVGDLATLIREIQKFQVCTTEELKELLVAGGHQDPQKLLYPARIDGPPADVVKNFRGREQEIEKLSSTLKPGWVVVLCGPGGVGKTTLVGKVIQQLAPENTPPQQFPDGILYYPFSEQEHTAENAFRYIADFFGVEVTKELSPRDVAIKALRGKQALIVLDSAEEADELRKVWEIRHQCGMLIVSRYEYLNFAHLTIYLDLLPPTEAVAALRAWSRNREKQAIFQVWSENYREEDQIAHQICEELGRLPLALRLAGQHMMHRRMTPAKFLEHWQIWHLSLLRVSKLQHQHDSLSLLMKVSLDQVNQVSEGAREVMAVTGILSYQSFTAEVIAAALEKSTSEIEKLLQDLWKFSLLVQVSSECWQVVHRLIYTYAQSLYTSDEVTLRLAQYYAAVGKAEGTLGREGYQKLDPERAHILAVLARCVDRKIWEGLRTLDEVICTYLLEKGDKGELIKAAKYELTAAQAVKNRDDEAFWLSYLGCAYLKYPTSIEAVECFQKALDIRLELDERYNVGISLKSLGVAYIDLGELERAIDYLQQARTIFEEFHDHKKLADIYRCLGHLYDELERYEEANDYHEMSLDMLDYSLNYLGLADAHLIQGGQESIDAKYLGETDWRSLNKAASYYHKWIDLHPEDVGVYVRLGVIAFRQGNEFRKHFEAALAVWDKAWQQRYQEPVPLIETKVLSAFRIGSLYNSFREPFYLLENKALAYVGLGEEKKAIATLKEALAQRQTDDMIDFFAYDLLEDAPNPPQGLAKMRHMLEDDLKSKKKTGK